MNIENEAVLLHLQNRVDVAQLLNIEPTALNRILSSEFRARSYIKKILIKSNGSERQIHAVHGQLKYLQRKLLQELQHQETFSPTQYSHGFVPERNILTNANIHVKKKLLIKVDIENFFPSIKYYRIKRMFQAYPFRFGEEAADALASLVCLEDNGGALPQGAPTSPYVANMVARTLDFKLAGLAMEYQCEFSRYADDITFSTNKTFNVIPEEIIEKIYDLIRAEQFTPNETKTQILTRRDRQITAGIVVNEGLNINRTYLRSIRATVHNCEKSFNILDQIAKTDFKDGRTPRADLFRHADGRFSYGNWYLTDGMAVHHFFQHLYGRIQFARNVVGCGDAKINSHMEVEVQGDKITAVGYMAVEKLYQRFYKLTLKIAETYRELNVIRDALNSSEEKSSIEKDVLLVSELKRIRKAAQNKSLSLHDKSDLQKNSFIKMEELRSAKDISDFCLDSMRHHWTSLYLKYRELKQHPIVAVSRMRELMRYPPESFKKSQEFLGHVNNGSLFKYFHASDPAKPFLVREVILQFVDLFDRNHYEINLKLRHEVDMYIERLLLYAEKHGSESEIDLLAGKVIGAQTKAFQKKIRIGNPQFAGSNCTSLEVEIRSQIGMTVKSFRREFKKNHINNDNIVIGQIKYSTFFSHIPSIRNALNHILRSSLDKINSDDKIRIEVSKQENSPAGNALVMTVSTRQTENIESGPDREFMRGDIINAIEALIGIGMYFIEARFGSRGSRHTVDMMSGLSWPSSYGDSNDFIHTVVLQKY